MKGIDDCFERGLLRKVEPSLAKGNQSLIQAGDWLSEAEKNLQAEAYRSALSSAYSAIFHSARAVLFGDRVREKSHYCRRSELLDYAVFRMISVLTACFPH